MECMSLDNFSRLSHGIDAIEAIDADLEKAFEWTAAYPRYRKRLREFL